MHRKAKQGPRREVMVRNIPVRRDYALHPLLKCLHLFGPILRRIVDNYCNGRYSGFAFYVAQCFNLLSGSKSIVAKIANDSRVFD